MKRSKHKKDHKQNKIVKAWQGWMRPTNKTLRKSLNKEETSNGGFFKKIGTWFEWN